MEGINSSTDSLFKVCILQMLKIENVKMNKENLETEANKEEDNKQNSVSGKQGIFVLRRV